MFLEATEADCLWMLEQLDRHSVERSEETVCFGGNVIEVTVNFKSGAVTLEFVGAPLDYSDTVQTLDVHEFRSLLERYLDRNRFGGP